MEMLFEIASALFLTVIAIILLLLLYSPLVSVLTRDRKLKKKQLKAYPPLTVIIPTYREEANIEEKIENTLQLDYPDHKLGIIVVDGGSEDKTRKLARNYPVKVVDLKERGKIKAINKGLEISETKRVVLTDADVRLKENILKESLSYINGDIKAVGAIGKLKRSEEEKFYTQGKIEYHKRDWYLRKKKSLFESCCSLDGRFIMLDTDYINKIDENAYTDDLQLTIQLAKKNLRSVIIDDSHFSEMEDNSWKEEINQMRRRCGLSLANSFQNLGLIGQKPGPYWKFIFPLRRFINFFAPFLVVYLLAYLYIFFPFLFLTVIAAEALLSLIKAKIFYYNLLLISLALAWFDLIVGNLEKGCIWNQ